VRQQQHQALAPDALTQWMSRGLRTTVSYYSVPAASGADVNWSAGTAAVSPTVSAVDGVWSAGQVEVQNARGGGMLTADALFVTAGPSSAPPTTRDHVLHGGLRYDVVHQDQPLGGGGLWLLLLRRGR
jgi:hypothetical protein